MTLITDRGEGQPSLREPSCARCGKVLPPQEYQGRPRKYCSRECRDKATWERRKADRGEGQPSLREPRKRRPLPVAAKDAAWALRKNIERVERVFADDRFAQNKEQVATLLRSHLAYTAEVCQDLLSRIDHPIGE